MWCDGWSCFFLNQKMQIRVLDMKKSFVGSATPEWSPTSRKSKLIGLRYEKGFKKSLVESATPNGALPAANPN